MMKLEEAVKELKNIWKETDFENSKRRIAIETVLKKLEKLQKETIPKKKIEDKIKEYFEYDRKHKTYTKDGRENFTIEYYKAKTLQELLEEK